MFIVQLEQVPFTLRGVFALVSSGMAAIVRGMPADKLQVRWLAATASCPQCIWGACKNKTGQMVLAQFLASG